jgi:hypothetical protein
MPRIEVSTEVWNEIAKRGKFGESEDDVLRRVFGISQPRASSQPLETPAITVRATGARRKRFATQRMSSFVQNDALVVEFHGGRRRSFSLPPKSDKTKLRAVRDEAVAFAVECGASYGQEMAVKKALTEAGYHLVR